MALAGLPPADPELEAGGDKAQPQSSLGLRLDAGVCRAALVRRIVVGTAAVAIAATAIVAAVVVLCRAPDRPLSTGPSGLGERQAVEAEPVEGRYETKDQAGARIPPGGKVRLYFVGGSNVAWQTWPDQLHGYLHRMNFTVLPGNFSHADLQYHTEDAVVCDDEAEFRDFRTPRIARPGWGSWGFAYDSTEDCFSAPLVGEAPGRSYPFRRIAGHDVSCLNGWACKTGVEQSMQVVRISDVAEDAGRADIVMLSTWNNDFKQHFAKYKCYNGTELSHEEIAHITVENLRRLIQAIHRVNPDAFVVVIGLYPDSKRTLMIERTLPDIAALNARVRQGVAREPNATFVDFVFPAGQDMYQIKNLGHPNCRGDGVMVAKVLEALFEQKVLGRTLVLPEGKRSAECLRASSCSDIVDKACCQAAAVCRVDPLGACVEYGAGQ